MFEIGWSELLVIGIVALIAIGPKELPGVLRMVGQWMGKVRRMASDFQSQFHEAMREAEMGDLKKQVDDMTSAATDLTNFNPMESVQKDLDAAMADKPKDSAAASSTPPTEATASVSPEAAAPSTPSPVSADFAVPPADPSQAVTPSGPQPQTGTKTGEGA